MLFIGPPLWHPTKPWNIDSICKHTYTHKYMHSQTPLHMEHQGHYTWRQGGVLRTSVTSWTEERRTNQLRYFGLSVVEQCPRTVLALEAWNSTEVTLVLETPLSAFSLLRQQTKMSSTNSTHNQGWKTSVIKTFWQKQTNKRFILLW